jgi:hypothetical protein
MALKAVMKHVPQLCLLAAVTLHQHLLQLPPAAQQQHLLPQP